MHTLEINDFKPTDDKYHSKQVPYIHDFINRQLGGMAKDAVFTQMSAALSQDTASPLYLKLEETNGVWGVLLNLVYRMIEYRHTLKSESVEQEQVHRILNLLHQFWTNTYRFTPAEGEALLAALKAWLSQETFEGDPALVLDVFTAIYMVGRYMMIAKKHPPLLLRAMMSKIQPIMDGFGEMTLGQTKVAGDTPAPSMVEQQFLSVLRKHPALSEVQTVRLTPQNASTLIINELKRLRDTHRKQFAAQRHQYHEIKKQLDKLTPLHVFLEKEGDKLAASTFWGYFSTEEALKETMTALRLSEKDSQSWLTSYRSYHATGRIDGFFKGASYYWSGAAIKPEALQALLLNAVHQYHLQLTQNPSEMTDIRKEIDYLYSYIAEEPFTPPNQMLSEQIQRLTQLAHHLAFNPVLALKQLEAKKKGLFQALKPKKRKNTDTLIDHLLIVKAELTLAHDNLLEQAQRMGKWLAVLKEFNDGLNTPLFQLLDINIEQVDELYRILIQTMHAEIVQQPNPSNDAPLTSDMLDDLHRYHENVINRLRVHIRHLDSKIALLEKASSDIFLPMLISYFANLEESFLQRFSLTFTALYSKVFSTLESLSAQQAPKTDTFFQHLNISLTQSRESARLWKGGKQEVLALEKWFYRSQLSLFEESASVAAQDPRETIYNEAMDGANRTMP